MPHTCVAGIGDEQTAVGADRDPFGSTNLGLCRWAPIATVATSATTDDGGDNAVGPDPANPAVVPVRDIQTPVGSERDVVRHRQLRLRGWSSVAASIGTTAEAKVAISCHGGNDTAQCLGVPARTVALVEDLSRGVIDMMWAQAPTAHLGTERAKSALGLLPKRKF